MTDRELRLRQRIDTLTDQRDRYWLRLRRQYKRVETLENQLAEARNVALKNQLANTELKAALSTGNHKTSTPVEYAPRSGNGGHT